MSGDVSAPPTSLLEKTQKLIELERLLTISLEKVEPWLTANTTSSSFASRTTNTRVRPIPTNMDQVHQILAVARNLSTRTSAPAGWNPAAPVMGFSTPNPLPHQLRGGALGALELERARQKAEQEDRKRKLESEQNERMAAKQKQEQEEAKMDIDESSSTPKNSNRRPDPKAADAAVHRANPSATSRAPPRAAPQAAPVVATTMNLSDSSSEDDDSDDSDS